MAVKPPVYIPPAPEPPDRRDRPTFNVRARDWANYQKEELVPGVNAALNNIRDNAEDAATSANSAGSSKTAAEVAAATAAQAAEVASAAGNATQWDAATAYTKGQVVWVDGVAGYFIRRTNGTSAARPDTDSVNWQLNTTPATVDPTLGPALVTITRDANGDVQKVESMVNGATQTDMVTRDTAGYVKTAATTYRGQRYTQTIERDAQNRLSRIVGAREAV